MKLLIRILKIHFIFILIAILYLAFCLVVTQIYNIQVPVIEKIIEFWIAYCVVSIIFYLIYCALILRPDRPISYLKNTLLKSDPERIISFFIILLIISVIFVSFRTIKPLIPVINPFSWDTKFARLDAFIHGNDPWKIIYPYLSSPFIIRIFVFCYCEYFFVLFVGIAYQAAMPNDSIRRMQFLVTFALCWIILGNFMAVMFSSAGPCYYSYVTGDTQKYSELMAFLNSPNTPAGLILHHQDKLWLAYVNNDYNQLFSISAMPSMHVSLMVLLVLSTQNHIAKILSFIFTIIVSLACVILAWHYAVDVYAAIIGTYLIWYVVGLVLKRKAGRKAPL